MKSSKHQQGFFLLYELLCFVFTSMLLATTAHGFTASFQVQQRSLELQEAWQVAQLTATGVAVPTDYNYQVELEEKEHKYNIAKNELFARNGKPCKTIVIRKRAKWLSLYGGEGVCGRC